MAVEFFNASNQGLFTAYATDPDISGAINNWAVSYWAELPDPVTIQDGGQQCFLNNFVSGGNSWLLWHTDPARQGGVRARWEAYNSGGNIFSFTAPAFDAFFNSGIHCWVLAKTSPTEVSYFVDGGLIETIAPGVVVPGIRNAPFNIGNAGGYGASRNPSMILQDVRLYKDTGFDLATLAENLFQARGNDRITDGLIFRVKLNAGIGTALAEAGVSDPGRDIITVQNAPQYFDAPLF